MRVCGGEAEGKRERGGEGDLLKLQYFEVLFLLGAFLVGRTRAGCVAYVVLCWQDT